MLLLDIYKDNIYEDVTEDVDTRFDTSNYELDKPLPKRKNKRVIGLMKNQLCGKVTTKFVGLRIKTYGYSIDDVGEDKNQKVQKSES